MSNCTYLNAMPARAETLSALQASFGDLAVSEFREATRVVVPREKLAEVMQFLRDQARVRFAR